MRAAIHRDICAALLLLATALAAQEQAEVRREANRLIINAVGTETTQPDVIHLMMKMESQAAQAGDAISQVEEHLHEFLAAVDQLKVPNLTYTVANNVFTLPQTRDRSGIVYTRNIIFALAGGASGELPADLDQVIAKLEDLGARYNSHCVTCIGSG